MQESQTKAWTAYWAAGHLHSLSSAFEANYTGPLAEFWETQFEALPKDAALLDIGTGNGAIPLLAEANERSTGWKIVGIDLAEVDANRVPEGSNVELIGGVSGEALPQDDASQDLVTSKYAFEYMPREASLSEIMRVLKPGGQFAAILHHDQSVIAQFSLQELQQIQLLGRSQVFPLMAQLLNALGDFKPSDLATHRANPQADNLRDQFNRVAGELHAMQNQFMNPSFMLGCLSTLVSVFDQLDNLNPAERQQHVEACRMRVALNMERLKDFTTAALTEDEFKTLCQQLEDAGMTILKAEKLADGDDLLGWQLVAQKANG